jgi:glucans biosynthesis protein
MQGRLPMLSSPRCGSPHAERGHVPVAGDAERPVPHARRPVARSPKGSRKAFKHGRYSAEAIARRGEIAALLRRMRSLARAAR